MASEEDYDVYQYSDEDGYSVEDDEEMPDTDNMENPNAPPVHYNKVGRFENRPHRAVANVQPAEHPMHLCCKDLILP